ncbi:MAG: hypothetical protein ABI581_11820 [Sediminibacterium sp.]
MISTTAKIIIVVLCFVFAVIGFLIKIPVPLRGNDKLLHTAFYFLAAAFLHFLFRKGLVIILVVLAGFGVLIEYMQELSNKLTRTRIHGRFDKEDIYANLKGLALYSAIALVYWVFKKMYDDISRKGAKEQRR